MNNFKFYKLKAIVFLFLINLLVVFPFSFMGVSLRKGSFRYGFDYYQLTTESALLIAAGLSLLITIWNVLEFGKHPAIPQKQYLKSSQKYKIKSLKGKSKDELIASLNKRILKKKRWNLIFNDDKSIVLNYRFYLFFRDRVFIEIQEDGLMIYSAPINKIFYLDLARNYRHIVRITQELIS